MDREYLMLANAHRLLSMHNADRIYTVGDGTTTESGIHHEQLDEGGKYEDRHGIQQCGATMDVICDGGTGR